MPSLKDIRRRIGSVKKTKQITAAMKLVAGAKLRRATEAAVNARPFQQQLSAVLARVAGSAGSANENPLLARREKVSKVLLVVLSTDRGLCGPFNSALLRQTLYWIEDKRKAGVEVEIHVFGRKGAQFLGYRKVAVRSTTLNYGRTKKMDLVKQVSDLAVPGFLDGTWDEVYIGFNRFKNALVQKPSFEQVLPLAVSTDDAGDAGEIRYEPDPVTLLDKLLPLYLRTLLLQAFLETEAGEFAARMTAMDSATRNASDIITSLTLQYNRARQAAITKEIIEIVSGAEAQ